MWVGGTVQLLLLSLSSSVVAHVPRLARLLLFLSKHSTHRSQQRGEDLHAAITASAPALAASCYFVIVVGRSTDVILMWLVSTAHGGSLSSSVPRLCRERMLVVSSRQLSA